MNIWAPQTEGDFDRFWKHNERYGMADSEQTVLVEWIKDRGDELTYKSGRPSRWLRDSERYTHRNYRNNKHKQYIYVFRQASADPDDASVEILAVYSSNEEWDAAIQRRDR